MATYETPILGGLKRIADSIKRKDSSNKPSSDETQPIRISDWLPRRGTRRGPSGLWKW